MAHFITPKDKVLTTGEHCCTAALGWRTASEIVYNSSAQLLAESVVDNADGTFTTEWISESTTESVYNDGGQMALTLCCGDYLVIDFESRDEIYPNNMSVDIYATTGDVVTLHFPPEGTQVIVHTEHPDLLPVDACGLVLDFLWEGGVTFSITHGKAP